jgi:TRAP-type C4-dicarboxylate transport system substrate-binding protein
MPVQKQIEDLGVTITTLTPEERDAFVKATRSVYDKWKANIGTGLVEKAEKAIAARTK